MNTLSIHRPGSLDRIDEWLTGKLAALIGIEDRWAMVYIERFHQRFDTERRIERVGQSPG